MTKFADQLWRDIAQEHGERLARAQRPPQGHARRPGPRVLAGSTLGLAGVGAALVLAFSGSAAPPAFAITKGSDGSVTVQINRDTNLPQANAKLAAMGLNEAVTIDMARGAATVSGAVNCTPVGSPTGPPLKVLVGTNGTVAIAPGQSAGNTAEGSFHLDHCVYGAPTAGNSGPADPGSN